MRNFDATGIECLGRPLVIIRFSNSKTTRYSDSDLGHLDRDILASFSGLISLVQIDQLGVKVGRLTLLNGYIGTDDHAIARARFMCGRPIHRYDTRALFGANGIGGKAFAIIDIVDLDLLILMNARKIQHPAVDCTRSFILPLCVRYASPMNF